MEETDMSGVLTEDNQIAGQIINIVNEQHRQFEEPVADIDRIYAEFRARFSPDVLENLDDSELLQYIFLTADSDNTSLCYYLELAFLAVLPLSLDCSKDRKTRNG